MAKKKQEIALQKELLNDESWDAELEHNGVLVIDVYQKWAGPCKATVALFRRIKNELGDELLAFAVAEADNISELSFYRGKCMPTFLFYAGKKLQAVVRGCNAPALERTINQQLANEHKVQSGEMQRTEYVDPEMEARVRAEEAARLEALKPKPIPKTCSVLVIKPDAVAAGHVEEILEKLRENGIEIVKSEERLLSEMETREMYKEHEEESWFEELVELMTSGPCHIAIVTKGATGEEVIPELRKLVGPTDAEKAKEEEPESIRALYGTSKLVNGVHAAHSKDQAASELAFFFPEAELPMQETVEPGQLQRTLAIIRPDAYRERGEEILAQIKGSGFQVALQKEMMLTREQVEEFYAEQKDEPHFEMLVENMTSGPVLALGLAREEAVTRWRDMLGPKEKESIAEAPQSLRAQFDVEEAPINQIHGSDSPENAEKEINFFFPKQKTLAVIKPNAMDKKEEIMKRIEEAGFEVAQQKESHLTKEMAEQFYSEHADKDFYPQLVEFMSSGETLFLVLAREDAVDGFRKLCGNKDPSQAKSEEPDSIRAMFGDDILRNAIHSSSTTEQAFSKIPLIFDWEKMGEAEEESGDVDAPTSDQQEADEAQEAGEAADKDDATEEADREKGDASDKAEEEGGEDATKPDEKQGDEGETTEKQDSGEDGQDVEQKGDEDKPAEEAKEDEAKTDEGATDEGTNADKDTKDDDAEKEQEVTEDAKEESETTQQNDAADQEATNEEAPKAEQDSAPADAATDEQQTEEEGDAAPAPAPAATVADEAAPGEADKTEEGAAGTTEGEKVEDEEKAPADDSVEQKAA